MLNGIDIIYYINHEKSVKRNRNIQKMFKDPAFRDIPIVRISAAGPDDHIFDRLNISMRKPLRSRLEYACLLSHLTAIRTFSKTNHGIALIMEDDMTLEYKRFWKPIKQVIANCPPDWDAIQLIYGNLTDYPRQLYTENTYTGKFFSAGAYLIRNSAKEFINTIYNNDRFVLNRHVTHTADNYIFTLLKTYVYKYPYFIYKTNNDSTLHAAHLYTHIKAKRIIKKCIYTKRKTPRCNVTRKN